MGIKYSFIDNMVYGPEDINDITKSLTGAGIAPFASKDSYDASDLNGLTSALVEAGASLDGCECCVENAGTAEMTVAVSQGIVFFESGVRLTVDEDGYTIPVTPNTAGYVYAHYSPSLQKADIVFGTELPTDGEYVVLARLEEDGSLKDKRAFARSRIATFGSNAVHSISEDRVTVYNSYDVAPSYSATEKIVGEIDLSGIDITKFNYLIYRYPYGGTGSTAPTYQEKYFNFINSERESFYIKGSLYYHSALCDIIFEGSKFVVVCVDTTQYGVYGCYLSAFKSAIPYFKLV
ncbi:MAG: hypothetical protein IJW15_01980 [Clostridia bacterium]|nr:hypothetical protein [Clostridia bacterium]